VEAGRHHKIDPSNEPWMMTVGFTYPHFPHIIPQRYASLYDSTTLPLSPTRDQPAEDQHPAIKELRRAFCNLETVSDEVQRESLRCHLGSVSFIDEKIGELLEHIDGSPLKENTVVIYTSDHGEMAGAHGIWQRQCFYEDSIRVPLLIRPPVGADSKPGTTVQTPVSLVDVAPTLLTLADTPVPPAMAGTDLLHIDSSEGHDRPVFSEYHAQGSLSGYYMIKQGNLKYNHYVDGKPELFDLSSDPEELRNLVGEPAYADDEAGLHRELLRTVGDPKKVDREAKEDQIARLSAAMAVSEHQRPGQDTFRSGKPQPIR
jgi:choline-sulfatase